MTTATDIALAKEPVVKTKVVAFAGSTRKGSYNQQLLKEATTIATEKGADLTVVDLSEYEMPFYNADLESEEGLPKSAKELRQLMISSDVIIIASPEYNGSFSALLKNTIDWTTRSEEGGSSRDAYKDKRVAIMSTSPGGGGGARGLVHLRQILTNIGAEVIPVEVSIPTAYEAFDEKGHLIDASQKEALTHEISQLLKS